jgi:hypothetical protein
MPGQYGERVSLTEKRFGDSASPGFQLRYANPQGMKLGGVPVEELTARHGLSPVDLEPYLPAEPRLIEEQGTEFHYLGYYVKWVPQEAYYYAVEHTGFRANPERTEGTYSKYNSLDDRIDGFHYWTTFVKFGIGRATYDASQEVRNRHITRDEAVALVRRFDGEFPRRYFADVLEYLGLEEKQFFEIADLYRSAHLWAREGSEWRLRAQVS